MPDAAGPAKSCLRGGRGKALPSVSGSVILRLTFTLLPAAALFAHRAYQIAQRSRVMENRLRFAAQGSELLREAGEATQEEKRRRLMEMGVPGFQVQVLSRPAPESAVADS